MGVHIKGMEMPKDEAVALYIYPDGRVKLWRPQAAVSHEYEAVPVPPHGRLIDADAILQKATKGEEPFDWIDKNELLRLFFDAPTILEAEEGET